MPPRLIVCKCVFIMSTQCLLSGCSPVDKSIKCQIKGMLLLSRWPAAAGPQEHLSLGVGQLSQDSLTFANDSPPYVDFTDSGFLRRKAKKKGFWLNTADCGEADWLLSRRPVLFFQGCGYCVWHQAQRSYFSEEQINLCQTHLTPVPRVLWAIVSI